MAAERHTPVRVAVLVDGDNVASSYAAEILRIASRERAPIIARVYANARQTGGWDDEAAFRMIHAGAGKNAADLLLAIDAIELSLGGRADAFVIVSSDGDFSHLAQRLREYGAAVTGVGEGKAPETFRRSCGDFVELGAAVADAEANVTDLDRKIRAEISEKSKKGQGISIKSLGQIMNQRHKIRINTLPQGNWRGYLATRSHLYDLDPKGSEAMVRIKPEGFAAGG